MFKKFTENHWKKLKNAKTSLKYEKKVLKSLLRTELKLTEECSKEQKIDKNHYRIQFNDFLKNFM